MLLSLILICTLAQAEELPPLLDLLPNVKSWTTTKKRMYDTIYVRHNETFYCGCVFNPEDHVVDLASCGMESLEGTRALRTEAEHIVPASAIGATRSCWEEGGRSHCLKVDPVFKRAHNDLHNLTLADGKINGDRSNYGWGLIEGEERVYGACDFEIDRESDRVEPRPDRRGDIARTYFYISWMYGVPISEGQRRLYLTWHRDDPVDDWELERNRLIKEVQGNSNPFVDSRP